MTTKAYDRTRDPDELAMTHNRRCAALWGARAAKDQGDQPALIAALKRARGHHAHLLRLLGVAPYNPRATNAATLAARAHQPGVCRGEAQLALSLD